MKIDFRGYVALLCVFILSVLLAALLPTKEWLKEVAALPAVCALLAAIYQIVRDRTAFERQQYSQLQQQAFSLGATSHMANIAFDKHAEFCERYVAEVHATVQTLFKEGPTDKALKHVWTFNELRREYAAWLPSEVVSGLEPFETAVNRIGALSNLVNDLNGTGDPKRQEALNEMYGVFREVMEIPGETAAERRPEVAVEAVKSEIRSILGIEQLTQLRKKLISQALSTHA